MYRGFSGNFRKIRIACTGNSVKIGENFETNLEKFVNSSERIFGNFGIN